MLKVCCNYLLLIPNTATITRVLAKGALGGGGGGGGGSALFAPLPPPPPPP